MNLLFKKRRSGRSYDASKLVPSAFLKDILEAARWAPSCFGEEPWRFIICEREANDGTYEKAFSCLVEANQKWVKKAPPILIISLACETFSKNHTHNRWAAYDTGAATLSLCLQAADLGLMAHQMGGFDEKKVREEFKIPQECLPMAVIALGYEAENASDKENPRVRKPLSQNFYLGAWDKGIVL